MQKTYWVAAPLIAAVMQTALWAQADGESSITEAFQKTKTAETVEDFSRIISLCELARERRLSDRMAAYAPKLMSWAHNRRGELYSTQAADSLAAKSTERAAELDIGAQADFERAVELDPQAWKPLHNRGVSYALHGEHEAAVRDFSRVVELKPDYVDAWFNRAEIRVDVGRFEQAIADYTQAIELQPDDEVTYLKRAAAFSQSRQLQRALSDYERAIELNVKFSGGYSGRGSVYEKLGRWAEAAADFRQAVATGQESLLAYRAAAWLMATCPEPKYRAELLAVQAAEQALGRSQQDWRTLDVLAAAYANAGRFEDAVKWASQAVAKSSGATRAGIERRLALYRNQKPYRQSPVVETAAAVTESR